MLDGPEPKQLQSNSFLAVLTALTGERLNIMKIRIVSATPHHDTNEVEIIIEKTINIGQLNEESSLHSVWIDCEIVNL